MLELYTMANLSFHSDNKDFEREDEQSREAKVWEA